jgi:hypothetical protein
VLATVAGNAQPNGQPEDAKVITSTIFHLDSLFWEAYNACDADKMATFLTDDMEFYHDKGGLTSTKTAFIASVKKGMCGNSGWRLRREPIEGTVKVYPMNNYGGLISGEHIFYINESGKKEYLDGYGKFTQVWRYQDGAWKMSRVLSYDHGPAPYINKRKVISIAPSLLKQYVGEYQSAQAGKVAITVEGNTLKFVGNNISMTIYPETDNLFFMKERDLQFEFVKEGNKIGKMVVHEKGNKVEEAKRLR